MSRDAAVVILAAGKGTRMNSELPKVLHPIGNAPMLHHAMLAAHALSPGRCAVVIGQGADAVGAAHLGRRWGQDAIARRQGSRGCVAALTGELDRLGFEPVSSETDPGQGRRVRVDFLHCPFRELAEAYPELVCNLHRGIVEGVVAATGEGMVECFRSLGDRDPCNVTVALGYAESTS